MGRLDEAREIVKRLRTMTSVVVPRAMYWRNPDDRELYLQGLWLAAGEQSSTMASRLGAILAAIVTSGADTLLPMIAAG